ncbi:hypothetical protein [Mucisphaera calidilacus]|uniref:Uncharacterized protein n=1 Tax=Mucisphaera calidilacus TaxID=2527982 RepID=A0A518C0Q8_9BACT|nr:hypothetical protein [Mucisphaera calidilacus]QDU72813.1 hypothetical protein Pan265_26870 [Mucisphaera calidilacus]
MRMAEGSLGRVVRDRGLLVVVDGRVVESARVTSMSSCLPLGGCEAEVEVEVERGAGSVREVVIGEPYRLGDARVGLRRLVVGGLVEDVGRGDRSGLRRCWRVRDRWMRLLDQELASLPGWWLLSDAGSLGVGADANRSATSVDVDGRSVYRPGGGLRWTAGKALGLLLAVAGVRVVWLVDRGRLDRVLERDVVLSGRLRGVLSLLAEDHGLVLRWDERHGVVEVGVRGHRGRRVSYPLGGDERRRPRWSVVSGGVSGRSVRGVCRSSGWRVESTFELRRGWDPGLEGLADDQYDPETSDDFTSVSSVFRRWVLNEDGAYSGAPYGLPAYDLSALFDDERVGACSLRFRAPLTRDTDGDPLPVLVEVSEDGGLRWRVVADRLLLRDRAGVDLTGLLAGSDYLAAARAGTVRCRVTARLDSPRAVEAVRWWGNAFTGVHEDVVFDAGRRFVFARVDRTSRFWSRVRSGARVAAERDDRERMRRWLLERLEGGASASRVRLEASGRETWLRPGDRLCVGALGGRTVLCERVGWSAGAGRAVRSVIEGRLEGVR